MTGTSSRIGLALLALAATGAGCGQAARPGPRRAPEGSQASWLRPGPAPAGWRRLATTSGAAMSYPPGWRPAAGDRGTATAILGSPGAGILGYLNLTPRQGGEAIPGWAAFRLAHNAAEGDRRVQRLASFPALRFRTGHGACVQDRYTTTTGGRYIELACLVAGARATTVIVGAAPPRTWPQMAPQIERAISALTT